MILEDFQQDMMRCNRCSYCKVVPFDAMADARFAGICPSIAHYGFHSRSAGGRMVTALSLLKGRIDLDAAARDIIYQCQMCGGCDVSCKIERDLEPYEVMQQLRIRCVEQGMAPPGFLPAVESLKKNGNTLGRPQKERGQWAQGLGAKDLTREKAEVLFFAGCRYGLDPALARTARNGLAILLDAGVDVGTLGNAEPCCGGKAYEMGFAREMAAMAKKNIRLWKQAGVKTVVTPCAGCFQAFKVLYDKIGEETGVEVLHITEFMASLIKEGSIRLTHEIPLKVTYHDPCHLGRLAEPWVHWRGETKKVCGQMVVHDPPKKKRFGGNGVYDAPRDILRAIPGLEFAEMHRIREYAWCCGAGSGVRESYPELAESTAAERIKEAQDVGAEAIVSACSSCFAQFKEAAAAQAGPMGVFDIIDLVRQAHRGGE